MRKEIALKEFSLRTDKNYLEFLKSIKRRLKTAQIKAALAANSELIKFYWQLGAEIIEKQKTFKWGEQFLEQLSNDMRKAYPGMQGFSRRNLEYTRRFASLYPNIDFAKQLVSQLPWGHLVRLIQMVKNEQVREWYAQQAIKNGWSRSILEMQIESGLFERQAKPSKKVNNFHNHLPKIQSELANEILKDPYKFDFLTISGKAHERAIEDGLIKQMKDFLLELGQGFAFVGSQVPLIFEEQEFFIDLLFYHLNLRSFIVIELKATKFEPKHTGQLGFYLAAVDDLFRREGDNRTIGILLCKSKSKIVVEYALRNVNAPIGVSEYMLAKALPKDLKINLPSIEEIEAELNHMKNMRN